MSEGPPSAVLVIESDTDTQLPLARLLAEACFDVRIAATGQDALDALVRAPVDLVILALDPPDVDGLELLLRVRAITDAPVIIVSARIDEADRVDGLDAGAIDYVVRPFSALELVARVRAQLRSRTRPDDDRRRDYPGLMIDPVRRLILVNGQPVDLRHLEFDLLVFLASSPGQVFSRAQLLEQVWDSDEAWQAEATVTEHVRRIREKIEPDATSPTWIQTVHGVGYRFERRMSARSTGVA
jgi:DNA-binding response OmpR family regulator